MAAKVGERALGAEGGVSTWLCAGYLGSALSEGWWEDP